MNSAIQKTLVHCIQPFILSDKFSAAAWTSFKLWCRIFGWNIRTVGSFLGATKTVLVFGKFLHGLAPCLSVVFLPLLTKSVSSKCISQIAALKWKEQLFSCH